MAELKRWLMRFAAGFAATSVLCFSPVDAAEKAPAGNPDLKKIFSRDPGEGAAYACFRRSYDKEHLKRHPDQNVTDIVAFIRKPRDEAETYYTTLQFRYRDSQEAFLLYGGCDKENAGKAAIGCAIDCEGGWVGFRPSGSNTVLVDIPRDVRVRRKAMASLPADSENASATGRFGSDDKIFRLKRAALSDCLPLVTDKELQGAIEKGAIVN